MKYLLTIIVFLITVTSQAQWISFGTSLSTPSNLANANYSLSFGNETTTLVHIKNKPERFKMNDREEMNRNA